MTQARFVVFEGVDGAGKSSQLARLATRLEAMDRRVVRLVEPTHGPIGGEIRRRAQHGPAMAPREELELFMRDRRENVSANVAPALARGDVVLQDRYYFSTAAYQAARPALGLTPADVVSLHSPWAPRPDRVVVLDLPVDRGLERVRRRGPGDAFETVALQQAVRANFLALAAADPALLVVVDASGAPDVVAAAVWAALGALFA